MENAGGLFQVLEYVGTFAFSLAGALTAIDRKLDIFGVIIMGVTTAMGGGLIRDIIIGKVPPALFSSTADVLIASFTAFFTFYITFLFKQKVKQNLTLINNINNIFDALGLGIFSVLGVMVAEDAGYDYQAFFCIFLGTMTGVGGGMLRDVMTKFIPFIFCRRIYAVASIIGSAMYYYLNKIVPSYISVTCAVMVTFALRLCATHFKWNLPKVILNPEKGDNISKETIRPNKK